MKPKPTDPLAHLEAVHERYFTMEKIPMEDKIIAAAEERSRVLDLEPWEISEVVQGAMHELSPLLNSDTVDIAFDIVYEAVSEALTRARGEE